MSAVSLVSDLGGGRPHSSRPNICSKLGSQKSKEREPSGTMQLLDRLGYGLVSLSSSPDAGAGGTTGGSAGHAANEVGSCSDRACCKEQDQNVDNQHNPAHVDGTGHSRSPSVKSAGIYAGRHSTSSHHTQKPKQEFHHHQSKQSVLSPSATANLASLRRIRAHVTSADDRDNGLGDKDMGVRYDVFPPRSREATLSGDGGFRRGQPPPDAAAVFRGLRVLLEQNADGGSEEVALESLSVLKESVSWLSRTRMKEARREKVRQGMEDAMPAPRLKGPGHGSQAARACIASTVPSVIDCFSRKRLRGAAEEVLVSFAVAKHLPDAPAIVIEQLVHHGMEHDDAPVRLWSTRVSSGLLIRELEVDGKESGSLLKGLVGRVRDVEDGVVDAAVRALVEVYRTRPAIFRSGEACLDPLHRQLLRRYVKSSGSNAGESSNKVEGYDELGRGGRSATGANTLQGSKEKSAKERDPPGEGAPPAVVGLGAETMTTATSQVCPSSYSSFGTELGQSQKAAHSSTTSSGSASFGVSGSNSSGRSTRTSSGISGGSDTESSGNTVGNRSDSTRCDEAEEGEEEGGGLADEDDRSGHEDDVGMAAGRVEEGAGGLGREREPEEGGTAEDESEERPKFEPIFEGVTVEALVADRGVQEQRTEGAAPHHQHIADYSPPIPLLAGPAASEISAMVGGGYRAGLSAPAAEEPPDSTRTTTEGPEEREKRGGRGSRPGRRGGHVRKSVGFGSGENGRGTGRNVADRGGTDPSPPRTLPAEAARGVDPVATPDPPNVGVPVLAAKTQLLFATELAKSPSATPVTITTSVSPSRRGRSIPRRGLAISTMAKAGQGSPICEPSRDRNVCDSPLPSLSSVVGKVLCALADVEAIRGAGGVDKGGVDKSIRDDIGGRSPVLNSPTRFGEVGGNADWYGSGSAGVRRQARLRAMGDARRSLTEVMHADFDEGEKHRRPAAEVPTSGSANAPAPRLEELLVILLRLTDDPDFKIALLALQTTHALVVVAGNLLRPHLALVLQTLATRLGDHKVAARHHAMIVLSTLVRVAGLPLAAPLLVQHGLRSTTWRVREGALKLIAVCLLCWRPPSSSPPFEIEQVPTSKMKERADGERVRQEEGGIHGNRRGGDGDGGNCNDRVTGHDELEDGENRSGQGGYGVGDLGGRRRSPVESLPLSTKTGFSSGRGGRIVANPLAMDKKEKLLHDIGLMLTDERPEVRFACAEALVVAANVWGRDGIEVPSLLEHAGLLSSKDLRRRLTTQSHDPFQSLCRLGLDDIVDLDAELIPWHTSPHDANPKRRRAAARERANENWPYDQGDGVYYGKGCGGGGDGCREPAPRCWRSNATGEREEIAPWERRPRCHGSDWGSQGQRRTGGTCKDEYRGGEINHATTLDGNGDGAHTPSDRRRILLRGDDVVIAGYSSTLASSPNNDCGVRSNKGPGSATPPRPNRRKSEYGCGNEERVRDGGETHTYTPSWAMKSGSCALQESPVRGEPQNQRQRRRRPSSPYSEATQGRGESLCCSLSGKNTWRNPDDREEHERGSRWERNKRVGTENRGGTLVGVDGHDTREGDKDESWANVGDVSPKEYAAASHRSTVPDPGLLSSLKRGGSRNAKTSRRAVSATAGGGGGGSGTVLSSRSGGQTSEGNQASSTYGDDGRRSRSRPVGGVPAEPTTPVPVGRYDGMGRRSHMETTVQQPLPLSQTKRKGGGSVRTGLDAGLGDETFVTEIDRDSQESGGRSHKGQGETRPVESPIASLSPELGRRPGFHRQGGISLANKRRRQRREGERPAEGLKQWAGGEGDISKGGERYKAASGTSRREGSGNDAEDDSDVNVSTEGIRRRQQQGKLSPASKGGRGRATTLAPSPDSALSKPDSFDYLTFEDIRPSPNPSQELQRVTASLPRDGWPEIFHTLNSVRRLAIHHAPLLGSQSHLHALVRDVLGQAENLRSQVAKNALLTLNDLWRGLGDTLDPELPMVCPLLVKKSADKVEFLAEAARECVDEIVATATGSRALSAFLACGNHRSPAVRAKSALAILLCVRRRCCAANDASSGVSSSGNKRERGGSKGGGGSVSAREMDRLLSALPRFLQDGNQETRHHAKAVVAVLLEAGEVDEARLRREIPPPILDRLQREILSSSLTSTIGLFTPKASTPLSSSSSHGGSRRGRVSSNTGTINRRPGGHGPEYTFSGQISSPGGSFSSTASGGGGCSFADGGRNSGRREPVSCGAKNESHGGGGDDDGEEKWTSADFGRGEGRVTRHGMSAKGGDGDGDGGYCYDGYASGFLSPPLHRTPSPSPRSRRWAGERFDVNPYAQRAKHDCQFPTRRRECRPERRVAADNSGNGENGTNDRTEELAPARRAAAITPPQRKGGGGGGGDGSDGNGNGSSLKKRPIKAFHCWKVEMLPAVHAHLDSGDWRERVKGLEEAAALLEEYGNDLHAAGKSERLVDRISELLSDGNLKVNLLALESVVRLGSSMGSNLEPMVKTLVPAVCKNLASSNQQRIALAEEALDALCEAVDPCNFVQPVASLAQYGNIRLKAPLLTLLRNLTPEIGRVKPIFLTKYVRPAALSLVRENRPNVRDAGLSLLRAIEVALEQKPVAGSSSRARRGTGGGIRKSAGRLDRGERGALGENESCREKRGRDGGDIGGSRRQAGDIVGGGRKSIYRIGKHDGC